MAEFNAKPEIAFGMGLQAFPQMAPIQASPRLTMVIECRDAEGNLKWVEEIQEAADGDSSND